MYLSEALRAHHGNVGVGDGQDERAAEGRCRHGAKGLAVVTVEVGESTCT